MSDSNPSKKEFLKALADELHHRAQRKFDKRSVYASSRDEIWAMDLAQMDYESYANKGNKYILCVVDVYTKFAWTRPLKSKTQKETFDAFSDIIKVSKRQPDFIWVDKGGEFYNASFKKWMKAHEVEMYSTYSESKAVVAERFVGTIKNTIYKYFTAENTRNWMDVLQELTKKYNGTKHSTIGMTPDDASASLKNKKIDKVLNPKQKDLPLSRYRKPKFALDDYVRISRVKQTFEKGASNNWSIETFIVSEIRVPSVKTQPITYKLEDENHEPIEGSFYELELQKVKYPGVYLIDKVIKERKTKQGKEYFVSWLGFPKTFDSWVKEADWIMGD